MERAAAEARRVPAFSTLYTPVRLQSHYRNCSEHLSTPFFMHGSTSYWWYVAPHPNAKPNLAANRATLDQLQRCAAANGDNWSSMHQDVGAGRRTEVDQLNGWAAERAAARGLPCGANEELAERVRALAGRHAPA